MKDNFKNTALVIDEIINTSELKIEYLDTHHLNSLIRLFLIRYNLIFSSITELYDSFEKKSSNKFLLMLSLRSGIEDSLYIMRLKYLKSNSPAANNFALTLLSNHLKHYIDFYKNIDVLISESERIELLKGIRIDYNVYFDSNDNLLVNNFNCLKIPEMYKYIENLKDREMFKFSSEFYNNYSRVHHIGIFSERIMKEFSGEKAKTAIDILYWAILELCTYLQERKFGQKIYSIKNS